MTMENHIGYNTVSGAASSPLPPFLYILCGRISVRLLLLLFPVREFGGGERKADEKEPKELLWELEKLLILLN